MKYLFRALLAVGGACIILLLLLGTFSLIKKVWFGEIRMGQVAVLEVNGVLWDVSEKLQELDELGRSHGVKAIVVRINSPGGLVGPSQDLFEAFKKVDQKKPVLASLGSVAASGGYYAALGARTIFANSGTLTASIGVIMEFVNNNKLYEWAKVRRYTLKAGKFKDIGTTVRDMTEEERVVLMTLLNDVHDQFKGAVKERRKLSDDQLVNIADGRVLTGKQAYDAKLVDKLGGLEEAIAEAKRLAHLKDDAEVSYPASEGGFLRKLVFGRAGEALRPWAELFQATLPPTTGWRVMMLAP